MNDQKNTTVENIAPKEGVVSKKSKALKIIGIILEVILYVFFALCIVALIMSVVSKKKGDDAVNFFGTEMRVVVSGSMEKSEESADVSRYKIKDIPIGSMVFLEKVPEDEQAAYEWYSKLQVGDVLTFCWKELSSQAVVTHRIVDIQKTETGFIISLRGDNVPNDPSPQIIYTSEEDFVKGNDRFNYVIGKVTGKSVVLGNLVLAIKKPIGAALIIIVPCVVIIIMQVARIINFVNEERKAKAAAEIDEVKRQAAKDAEDRERQEREMEELKRRIAELEGKGGDSSDTKNNDG